MDFRFSEAEEAYRAEVRSWLAGHTPAWWQSAGAGDLSDQDEHFEDLRTWHRQLYEAGYVGTTWPREYGGRAGASQTPSWAMSAERGRSPVVGRVTIFSGTSVIQRNIISERVLGLPRR